MVLCSIADKIMLILKLFKEILVLIIKYLFDSKNNLFSYIAYENDLLTYCLFIILLVSATKSFLVT